MLHISSTLLYYQNRRTVAMFIHKKIFWIVMNVETYRYTINDVYFAYIFTFPTFFCKNLKGLIKGKIIYTRQLKLGSKLSSFYNSRVRLGKTKKNRIARYIFVSILACCQFFLKKVSSQWDNTVSSREPN